MRCLQVLFGRISSGVHILFVASTFKQITALTLDIFTFGSSVRLCLFRQIVAQASFFAEPSLKHCRFRPSKGCSRGYFRLSAHHRTRGRICLSDRVGGESKLSETIERINCPMSCDKMYPKMHEDLVWVVNSMHCKCLAARHAENGTNDDFPPVCPPVDVWLQIMR